MLLEELKLKCINVLLSKSNDGKVCRYDRKIEIRSFKTISSLQIMTIVFNAQL